jgi:hypothetical protein
MYVLVADWVSGVAARCYLLSAVSAICSLLWALQPAGRRGSPLSSLGPGVLVGPPPRSQVSSNVIKREKSTSNSAGSSVGSLAPPRATGHPAAGRCVRVVPVLRTSLAPLYSPCACASSAFDWGSKPHSRSAPAAPVGSSPGPRTHCPFHRYFLPDCLSGLTPARAAKARLRVS